MNTWRVRKRAPWEMQNLGTVFPWVIERAVWGRWELVGHRSTYALAIMFADRQARR